MKKVILTLVVIAVFNVVTACVPDATEQEKTAMCKNLVNLRSGGEPKSEAELVKDVKDDFVKRKKHLEDWKARDLKGWDDELASKLKKLTDDKKEEESAKLKEDYAKKKKITVEQFEPDIAKLGPEEVKAIEMAKKKAVALKQERQAKVKECLDKAATEGVNQKVAQCRANAKTVDKYWNICN